MSIYIRSLVAGCSSNKTSDVSGLKTYTYDAAGNITSDGVNALVYDDRGRLKSFGSVNYKINGLGQRLQKDSSRSKVRFMYNENGNLMGEYDGSDTTLIEHVWLNGQIIGALKPNAGATDMFYVYTDQIGAPRAITTNAGTPAITWTCSIEPNAATRDNNYPFGSNTANAISLTYNVRLPGQYFDSESGMHYNYFRDYDPAVGQYATSDPIGLWGGLNTYAYVEGNPISKIDPTGTIVIVDDVVVGGIVITMGCAITPACVQAIRDAARAAIKACTTDESTCSPPEGTRCYSGPDTTHNHGGLTTHYHIFQMFKFGGKCQWKYLGGKCQWKYLGGKVGKGVFAEPPAGMSSCSAYPGFQGR